jgi:hypothetical protein
MEPMLTMMPLLDHVREDRTGDAEDTEHVRLMSPLDLLLYSVACTVYD